MSIIWTKCKQCKSQIVNFSMDKVLKHICDECARPQEPGVRYFHDRMFRCPGCGHKSIIHDDLSDLFTEGKHEVCCEHCDEEFVISTEITFTFWSPKMKGEQA